MNNTINLYITHVKPTIIYVYKSYIYLYIILVIILLTTLLKLLSFAVKDIKNNV